MQAPLDLEAAEKKRCGKCGRLLDKGHFAKNAARKDQLQDWCRGCSSQQMKESRKSMRYHKFKAIFSGLSAVAKKIYSVVPISEAWDVTKIKMELARTSTPTETRLILGCLTGLVANGLVKESPKGVFQRTPVDAKQEAFMEGADDNDNDNDELYVQEEQMTITANTKTTTPAQDPIEKISKLASQCQEILATVGKLQSDIETVAIEVQEAFQSRDAEVQKLKQLQQLLKSLG